MSNERADFTLSFRELGGVRRNADTLPSRLSDLFIDREALKAWGVRYQARLQLEAQSDEVRQANMNRVNPRFVLRNHLAQTAIESAQQGDFSEVQRLLDVLSHPYDESPQWAAYADLPPSWAQDLEISCSS